MKKEIRKTIADPEYQFRYETASTQSKSSSVISTKTAFNSSQLLNERKRHARKNKVDLKTVIIQQIEPARVLHSIGSPALVQYHDNGRVSKEQWWLNGKRHRDDGAAETWYDEKGNVTLKLYYLNGKYTEKNQLFTTQLEK